jgi:hypothetical protein
MAEERRPRGAARVQRNTMSFLGPATVVPQHDKKIESAGCNLVGNGAAAWSYRRARSVPPCERGPPPSRCGGGCVCRRVQGFVRPSYHWRVRTSIQQRTTAHPLLVHIIPRMIGAVTAAGARVCHAHAHKHSCTNLMNLVQERFIFTPKLQHCHPDHAPHLVPARHARPTTRKRGVCRPHGRWM